MTKSPYLMAQPDYATREDLNELKDDIVDRIDVLEVRIEDLEDNIEEGLESVKIDVATQNKSDMATWREIIQDNFKLATEMIMGQTEVKLDAMETRINKKLDRTLSQSYFEEYMGDFKKAILRSIK